MTITDIDKQLLLELCKLYQDFLAESEVYDGADFWGNSRVEEIRKQLHDQAKAEQIEECKLKMAKSNEWWNNKLKEVKAEQREEIDKHKEQIKHRMEIEAARGKEFDDKYIIGKAIGLRYALDYLDGKFDDIASEIRGQHECKQTTPLSLQVKEQ